MSLDVHCAAALVLAGSMACLPARCQKAGTPPEWEVRAEISKLANGLARLKPMLEQVRPQEWTSQGASETYVAQWKSVRSELEHLDRSVRLLMAEPDRLTAALDTFFRVDRLQALLSSLEQGVRRYQNPALADLLSAIFADSAPAREGLRQYVLDLAEMKEHELKVADQEAQRCRDFLVRQPPARPAPSPKTNTNAQPRP